MAVSQIKLGAALSYFSIILNNIIGLLYTPFMLRMMGQSEYGLYSLVASIIAYLTILDLGFGNAIVRYIAKYRAENKVSEQYDLLGMFFRLYLIIGGIAFIIGLIFYFNANSLFARSMTPVEMGKIRVMMLLMCINLAFTFPMSIWGAVITAYERFVFQKVVNIIRIVLNPVIMTILLFSGYKSVGMVVLLTVLNVITLLLNCYYCACKLHMKLHFGKIQWCFFKEISLYSFWIFVDILVSRFYSNVGQIVVGIYRGATFVAIYALAIQLKSLFSSIALSINSLFLPRITMLVSNNNSENVTEIFLKVGRIQFLLLSFVLVGFVIFGKAFITLWGGSNYVDVYYVSLLLIVPFFFDVISNIGVLVLQAQNKLKIRSIILIIGALSGFLVSLVATDKWGVLGCAAITGLTILICNVILSNIVFYKVAKINVLSFWKNIIHLSLFPIITILLFIFYLNKFLLSDSFLNLGINIICFSLIYLPIYLKMSVNSYERNLLKKLAFQVFRK